MIRVQREDFDVGAELEALTRSRTGIGGVTSFLGLVRDLAGDRRVGQLQQQYLRAAVGVQLQEKLHRLLGAPGVKLRRGLILIGEHRTNEPGERREARVHVCPSGE